MINSISLFSLLQVNEDLLILDDVKTIALMRRLFDNYELDTHAVEQVTPEEEQEELEFLNAVLDTPIMKKTMKFLEFKGQYICMPKVPCVYKDPSYTTEMFCVCIMFEV